jgi:hypothetical protein
MSIEKLVLNQVKCVSSRNLSRREEAMGRLRAMGPEVVMVLHHIMDTRRGKWRERQPRIPWALLILGVLFIAAVADKSGFRWDSPGDWVANIAGISCLAGLVAGSFWSLKSPDITYQGTAIALADMRDFRSFSRIVETYHRGDRPVHEYVCEALCEMIPKLSADDVSSFNQEQADNLYSILSGKDVELTTVLLSALPKLEAADALPYVEQLAAGRRLAAKNKQVKRVAEAVLPVVRGMADQRAQHSVLLRAGSADASNKRTALRPAEYAPESHPDELLRVPQGDK